MDDTLAHSDTSAAQDRRARSQESEPPTGTPTRGLPTGYTIVNEGYQLWATHGLASGVQFQRVNQTGVGNIAVIDLGVLDAIDVWGYVEPGVQVCFPQEGHIAFLDAAYSPGLVTKLADVFFTSEGYTCVNTKRAGTIVRTKQPLWF